MTRKQLGGTSKATSLGMLPRNIKQIQNMSYMKPSSSFTSSKDVLVSLDHCRTTLNDPEKSFIRRVEGSPEPMCVVGTEVAFSDLEPFCRGSVEMIHTFYKKCRGKAEYTTCS